MFLNDVRPDVRQIQAAFRTLSAKRPRDLAPSQSRLGMSRVNREGPACRAQLECLTQLSYVATYATPVDVCGRSNTIQHGDLSHSNTQQHAMDVSERTDR